jgi:hypothetical protein
MARVTEIKASYLPPVFETPVQIRGFQLPKEAEKTSYLDEGREQNFSDNSIRKRSL